MKTCPVCEAIAFDDAQLCYGCMHRFEKETEEEIAAEEAVGGEVAGGDVVGGEVVEEAVVETVAETDADKSLTPGSVIQGKIPLVEEADVQEMSLCQQVTAAVAPSFMIKFTPDSNPTGVVTWSCEVEMATA